MQLIACPWCGPREEVEFHYGGQAHVAYPEDPPRCPTRSGRTTSSSATTPRAAFAERWSHSRGCRRWFNAVRDTATHRFERVYRLDEPKPVTADDAAPSAPPPAAASTAPPPSRSPSTGSAYTGHPGDTLASALLAAGRHQIATSIKLGRPRGITAAWAEDPGGLVQIEEPFPEPMLLATTVELYDGLVAARPAGPGPAGRRRRTPPATTPCTTTSTCSSSAPGPPGLAAALTAARAGARVALVDEQSEAGGSLLSGTDRLDGAPALDWVAAAVAELAAPPGGAAPAAHHRLRQLRRRLRPRARAAHRPPRDRPRPKHLSRQRVWRIRARSIVVATGAHERPVVFADNDRPGIMLAGAARTFLHRYGVLPGREAVVFTTNDSAYDAALDLHRAGVRVQAVVDARPAGPARRGEECERRGHRGPPRAGS